MEISKQTIDATPCYGIYPVEDRRIKSDRLPDADNLAFGGTDGLNLTVDSYDADKAKEILADAGYQDTDGDGILDKDGVNLSFKVLTYSYNDNCIQLADMLQAELSQIGIELSIETQDVLDDPLASGDFDLAILNYAMAPIDKAFLERQPRSSEVPAVENLHWST